MWWTKRKEPEIGVRYRLRGHPSDPWGIGPEYGCTVVDVKDGWVRYRIGNAEKDDAAPIKRFWDCYEPW